MWTNRSVGNTLAVMSRWCAIVHPAAAILFAIGVRGFYRRAID